MLTSTGKQRDGGSSGAATVGSWQKAMAGANGDGRARIAVIGAGFGRTGTFALCTALNQLGFRAFHMYEVVKQNRFGAWAALGRGDVPVDTVGKLLRGYTAATDFPACIYYKELLAQNPDAKVVLTVRDPEDWYRSARETIFKFNPGCYVLMSLPPFRGQHRALMDMVIRPVFGFDAPEQLQTEREHVLEVYRAHVEEVKRTVPPGQLLLYDVKDGWEPLCRFLGVPVPPTPFPRVNEAATFRRLHRAFIVVDRLLLVGAAAAVGWALYKAAQLLALRQ